MTYTPRAAVPEHVRDRDDVRAACAGHDLGRVFYLVRKWGGISYSAIADCTGIKPERVSALARGQGAITSYKKLTEIADGLRLFGTMFGLAPRPWESEPEPLVAGGSGGPRFGGLVETLVAADRPDRVSADDVEGVWASVRFVSSWDYSRGGGCMAAAAVSQHVRSAATLLRLPCDPRVRPVLFSAVGSLVLKAGFTAFDVFDHDRARQRFEFALACAEEVDDWHLRAGALASLARQAFWRNDLDEARTRADLAMVRAGETGHALADIATPAQHWAEAARRLSEASQQHGDAYARSRAFCDFRLTALLLDIGQVDKASAVGERALTDATEIRSRRLALDAGRVLRAATRYTDQRSVDSVRAGFRELAAS